MKKQKQISPHLQRNLLFLFYSLISFGMILAGSLVKELIVLVYVGIFIIAYVLGALNE